LILIPAIDLHEGNCVQLQRGELSSATKYASDAGELAKHWVDQGAERLHVVDLDGAFQGHSVNSKSVEKILTNVGDIPVQLGGGVRTLSNASYWLNQGISQVIIGTSAIESQGFLEEVADEYPNQVILGLDARGEFVSTRGWQMDTTVTVSKTLAEIAEYSLYAIVFTDIEQDGMLTGVNIEATISVLGRTTHSVIASGGVQDLTDVRQLHELSSNYPHLIGAISGTALYENRLNFQSAQNIFVS